MTTCEVDNCERGVYARGLCGRHDKQRQRHGAVQPERVERPCAVDDCERTAVTRGWCHGHYLRWSRTGDVRADVPLSRSARGACSVTTCNRPFHGHGLCRTHLRRMRVLGDADASDPVRFAAGNGWISHGYRGVPVPQHLRTLTNGRARDLEHRLVMAVLLERPLRAGESVHHLNGDRLDNRPANLELWSSRQPSGQRIEDKLMYAYEIIELYDPHGWRRPGGEPNAAPPGHER